MSWSYFNYSKINKKCYTKINTITSAKLAVTVGLLSLCILLFSRRYFSMSVCVSVRLPFAWHTVLSSYFTLSRSFFLSMVSLVGLGLARFFSFKKTEIEIFFNSCKVKNSSIWWWWWWWYWWHSASVLLRSTQNQGGLCVFVFFTFASFYFLRRFARVVFICLCECVGLWDLLCLFGGILLFTCAYWIFPLSGLFFCCVGKVICFLPFYFQFR